MVASLRYLVLVAVLCGATIATTNAARAVRPATNMASMIAEENAKCESGEDSMACIKVRAMRFLDTVINNDNYKFGDVEVHANGFQPAVANAASARSTNNNDEGRDLMEAAGDYLQSHDITMALPLADAKVTVSTRNLANDELTLNVKLAGDDDAVVEGKGKKGNFFKKGKKHRMRKMIMPIMVLILLKAMTVIPMAIGILKIKAFNALALGFFSFIVSVGLAIFQLCKKNTAVALVISMPNVPAAALKPKLAIVQREKRLAAEHHSAHITAHGPWDGRAVGGLPAVAAAPAAAFVESSYPQNVEAQKLAYKAYA